MKGTSSRPVVRLLAEERKDLAALLQTLSEDEWEAPSLCAGWRVRDVAAHLLYNTMSMNAYGAVALRHGFSPDKVNGVLVDKMKSLSTSALVEMFDSSGRDSWSRWLPGVMLADSLVHHQDIRRPLGRERSIPEERMIRVLDHPDPFAWPRRYTRGLRFIATDVTWSSGDGPEVRGTGEALALAMVGRSAVLAELSGDGLPELRKRHGQA